jgi:hypothetical protein
MALVGQPAAQLARECGLARSLEPGEHDHRRRVLGQLDPPGLPAEDRHKLLVDDLHDLLGRVERAADLSAERPLADRRGELADDRQCDVGLEQGETDVADRGVDVGLGQPTLAPQVPEGDGQAVGKAREHRPRLSRRRHGGAARHRVWTVMPSQASITSETAWATRAGGSGRPPNSVR